MLAVEADVDGCILVHGHGEPVEMAVVQFVDLRLVELNFVAVKMIAPVDCSVSAEARSFPFLPTLTSTHQYLIRPSCLVVDLIAGFLDPDSWAVQSVLAEVKKVLLQDFPS